MNLLTMLARRAHRAVLARRRLLAGLLAAVAVAAGLRATSPTPVPHTMVLTAVHALAAGTVVGAEDLQRTPYAPGSVPSGLLSRDSAVGRTTAGPVRAGEPLTDARLVTSSLLDGYPGLVAVPVRIGDPGSVGLLRAGDRVDLLAADPQGRSARTVGQEVPVLAIPRPGEESPGLTTGALVVVGVPPSATGPLAQASVSSVLSVVLTR